VLLPAVDDDGEVVVPEDDVVELPGEVVDVPGEVPEVPVVVELWAVLSSCFRVEDDDGSVDVVGLVEGVVGLVEPDGEVVELRVPVEDELWPVVWPWSASAAARSTTELLTALRDVFIG
jgi:hypothetical protein